MQRQGGVDQVADGSDRGVDLVSKLCQQSGFDEWCGCARQVDLSQGLGEVDLSAKVDLIAPWARWICSSSGSVAAWAKWIWALIWI